MDKMPNKMVEATINEINTNFGKRKIYFFVLVLLNLNNTTTQTLKFKFSGVLILVSLHILHLSFCILFFSYFTLLQSVQCTFKCFINGLHIIQIHSFLKSEKLQNLSLYKMQEFAHTYKCFMMIIITIMMMMMPIQNCFQCITIKNFVSMKKHKFSSRKFSRMCL